MKLGIVKNYMTALTGNGELLVYDSKLVSSGTHTHPIQMKISDDKINPIYKVLKFQSAGFFLLIGDSTKIRIFEVIVPKVNDGFDFANIRIIGIVIAVVGALLWQYFKKGSKKVSRPYKTSRKEPKFNKKRR